MKHFIHANRWEGPKNKNAILVVALAFRVAMVNDKGLWPDGSPLRRQEQAATAELTRTCFNGATKRLAQRETTQGYYLLALAISIRVNLTQNRTLADN